MLQKLNIGLEEEFHRTGGMHNQNDNRIEEFHRTCGMHNQNDNRTKNTNLFMAGLCIQPLTLKELANIQSKDIHPA